MRLLDRLLSNNSRCLEQFELGTLSSQPPSQETISARGLSSCSWRVRFDLPSSINLRHINALFRRGPAPLLFFVYRGQVVPMDSTYGYTIDH